MLTPVDIQNKIFKGGIGFDKKDVETFMSEITTDYSMLYRSNVELNDKVKTLSESLQHYKSIEDSMQKALTLSEKTSEETINAANDKARQVTTEAEMKAETILADAKEELENLKNEISHLKQEQKNFKEQYGRILRSQLKVLDYEMADIDLEDGHEHTHTGFYGSGLSSDHFGSGLGNEGGLGGGLGSEGGLGGGYTGANPSNFEKTAQSPTFDRGSSLGMDPFASTSNGGRFSKQTGGDYTASSDKKNTKSAGKSGTSLNFKSSKSQTVHRATAMAAKANKSVYYSTVGNTTNYNQSESIKTQKTIDNETIIKENNNNAIKNDNNTYNRDNVKVDINDTINNSYGTKTDVHSEVNSTSNNIKNDLKKTSENIFNDVKNTSDNNILNEVNNASDNILNEVNKTSDSILNEVNKTSDSILNKVNNSSEVNNNNYEHFDNNTSNTFSQEEALSGEVESKVNESTMLDSEDNHPEGFDFVAGNEDEEEDIPTIAAEAEKLKAVINGMDNDNDVFVGDVESKVKFDESRMIGNDDDNNDTFNFM